jgi:hypothetical protein
VEITCDRVRDAFRLLKEQRPLIEVQAFGDRINVVLQDATTELPDIEQLLAGAGIVTGSRRTIAPSLENVFISLLTHTEGVV